MLEILFRREGYVVVSVPGYRAACEAITRQTEPFPVVLTDLSMPDGSGLDLVSVAKARSAATEVVLLTAHSTIENAIMAMRTGAYDFVAKPFQPLELSTVVAKALEKNALTTDNLRLRASVLAREPRELTGRSPAFQKVLDVVERAAPTRATVLITGESGTGKERMARAIHQRSERSSGPFLVINCGALPEALMESELFGHEKGAFTGADKRRTGLLREAEGGTVLLDEIGELPASLQVKLLRVLQERVVRPVGSTVEAPVDVRVLAATNRDVEADVEAGRFRQDLYYRLNVIRLNLPALRERPEDVPLLAEAFLRRFAGEMNKEVAGFTPDALRAIQHYQFPGNVRELENVIERAVALASARVIGLGDLPPEVSGQLGAPEQGLLALGPDGCDLDAVLHEAERRLLLLALERTGGVRTAAAKVLGVSFRSLRYRLEKHGLSTEGDLADGEEADEGRN
jgi:two-component system response regulator PilR (NtrC family)